MDTDVTAIPTVGVPEEWRQNVRPRRRFPKDCFYRSWRYVLDHDAPEARLVHGTYAPDLLSGTPGVNHAWVELPGGIVFDGVYQRFFVGAAYYVAMNCIAEVSYTPEEAARLVIEAGHIGPWHKR